MATYKADTRYSYKNGHGGSRGTMVHTLFTVLGKSESAILAEIKKRHGQQADIVINHIEWK